MLMHVPTKLGCGWVEMYCARACFKCRARFGVIACKCHVSCGAVSLVCCVQSHCAMLGLAEYDECVRFVFMERQLLVRPARMSAGWTYARLAVCNFAFEFYLQVQAGFVTKCAM